MTNEQYRALLKEVGGIEALQALLEKRQAEIRSDPAGNTRCRALRLRVLNHLDETHDLRAHDLAVWLSTQACGAGHRALTPRELEPDLKTRGDGTLGLNSTGEDHLLSFGRPEPDWTSRTLSRAPALRDWQIEALDAWVAHGRVGVVQAVTGTGKSRVGIEAAREALWHDYSVIVCVPGNDLVLQWAKAFRQAGLPGAGMLGGGSKASFETHNVVVGTVQSLHKNPPTRADGKVLLIADECHRYGSEQWRRALDPSYRARLGLTATLERDDDGIFELHSYFGGSPVYDIGFERAIQDGVVARYDVLLMGVSLTSWEQAQYDECQEALVDTRREILASGMGVPTAPFGEYMRAVAQIVEDTRHPLCSPARRYLKAFSDRGEIVASARNKIGALKRIKGRVESSSGTLVFGSRIEACEQFASVLVELGIDASEVYGGHPDREELLRKFSSGKLKALVAPMILDEGIDVPHADLGIVTSGSSSRRQMIQRMGRVLRLKQDGRKATFVVMYARGTNEDLMQRPANTDASDGFLGLITGSADSVREI